MHKAVETLQRPWFCAALLMLAVAAVYWPVIGFQFVDYDDQQYITDNAMVQRGVTPEGIRWAFTTFTASNWHPVTWLSHMVDCSLFGQRAGWHHAVNVLLHAINSVLVFLVLRRATGAHWPSLLVAALFALHPMHVESVAWVAERKDVLSTMFGLLAIGAYVRWVRSSERDSSRTMKHREPVKPVRKMTGMIPVIILFALSLMAKPMFVTLPCILLLMDWWPLRRTEKGERWMALVIEKLPLLALTIASCVITMFAQRTKGAMISVEAWPLAKRLTTAVNATAAYVWGLVWPTDLAVIYPHPVTWEAWRLPLSILTLLVMSAAAIVWWRRRAIPMGWLLFLGTLVPVIGLVQVGSQWMADRYTYVPSIGLFIMIAWAVAIAIELRKESMAKPLAIMGVFVVMAMGIAAHRQVWYWQDSVSLFSRAVEVVPRNHIAHNSLAAALTKRGDDAAAMNHVREAVRINPVYVDAQDFSGTILLNNNRLEAARAHFAMLLEEIPGSEKVRNNYASVLFRLGDKDGARREWERLLSAAPGNAAARRNLAALFMESQQLELAAAEYERSLQDETHADAHANLGAIRLQQNQVEAAVIELQKAVAMDARAVEARVSLGVAMARLGRWNDAIVQLTEALRLNPDHAQARMLLDAARQEQQAGRTP